MSTASSLRSVVPLLIGLIVGGVGVMLFLESSPGAPGSAEEQVSKLEVQLKQAENRLLELNALNADGRNRLGGDPRRTIADSSRSIMQRIRDGHKVSPEEIFSMSKPFIRDLAPLFDRMRLRDQRRRIDSLTGEITRKYDLTPEQQKGLKAWFDARAKDEAKRWSDLISREDVRLDQVMRATRDIRPDAGLDKYMEGVLTGDKLTNFKTQRLTERVGRVQHDADMKVQRMDSIVGLSDSQREEMFNVVARSSRDYDPSLGLGETIGGTGAIPSGAGRDAMMRILTPDQRAAYDATRRQRRDEIQQDMNAVGLEFPPDWEFLDDDDFR